MASRGWELLATATGVRLGHARHLWPVSEPCIAKCRHHRHRVPNLYCTCGIYALRPKAKADTDYALYGLVSLWGKYIEHARGWRAEFAYPLSFTGVGCSVCEQVQPIAGARAWLSLEQWKPEVTLSVSFICRECLSMTPMSDALLPAAHFIEALEGAYGLGQIPWRDALLRSFSGGSHEHRPGYQGRDLHPVDAAVADAGESP